MRKDINDDVKDYFKNLKIVEETKNNGKPQKGNTTSNKNKVVKCTLDHSAANSFRSTEQSWEVSKVECYGGCGANFEKVICNSKNIAWVCEGNKNNCYCSVVYCNKCYMEKIYVKKKRGRSTRNVANGKE